jgi:cytochrome c peroxidase
MRDILTIFAVLTPFWAAAINSEPTGSNGAPGGAVGFSPVEISKILQHSPLPALPHDPTNAIDTSEAAAQLGQFLFFDRRLSGNGQSSCATCHRPELNWTDGKQLSEGAGTGSRRTPSLWNVAYNRWFFWDGRADTLWSQALKPLEEPSEMNGSRVRVALLLNADPDLRQAYIRIFGKIPELPGMDGIRQSARPGLQDPRDPDQAAWAQISVSDREKINRMFSNVGKALAAYDRRIVSRDAPFDRFAQGLRSHDAAEQACITESAKRGLKLFEGRANCRLCHSGPNFSDGEFHNIRLPSVTPALSGDAGRFSGIDALMKDQFNSAGKYSDGKPDASLERLQAVLKSDHNWGEFKTPSLRNVADRSPYMHEGQFATLKQVLQYYSTLDGALPPDHDQEQILFPLNLSEQDIEDLVQFLKTLTGRPLDETLLHKPASPLFSDQGAEPRP